MTPIDPVITRFLQDYMPRGVHALCRQAPSALAQIAQIEAIPVKRHDQKLIRHRTMEEVHAILNAPDHAKRSGVRERAMLHLCFSGGLRVSRCGENHPPAG